VQGASDSLQQGRSTFLEEMEETSAILRTATSRSLVRCTWPFALSTPFKEQLAQFKEQLAPIREHMAPFSEHLPAYRPFALSKPTDCY
jgi:hypothetical protein